MKQEKETRHLIELLMAGDITPAEQRRLKELLSTDDLDEDLKVYRDMMEWMNRPLPVPDKAQIRQKRTFVRVAAMIAFMVCIGALAGTITYTHRSNESTSEEVVASETSENSKDSNSTESYGKDIRLAEDITFDNVPLAEIAKQMSETFSCTVVFADKEAESLRLYFTISRGSIVADFVTIIDEYETLSATIKDNTITIKQQEEQQ